MFIDKKIIISGDCIEYYNYEKFIYSNTRDSFKSRDSRVNLRRLIESNVNRWRDASSRPYKAIFLTLTFSDRHIKDSYSRHLFRLFSNRLNRFRKDLDGQLCKYTAVMEYQKDGVPHFHVLYYNLPYIINFHEILKDLWPYGYSLFRVTYGRAGSIATYMSKYLVKQFTVTDIVRKGISDLFGNVTYVDSTDDIQYDKYFSSKGLYKPVVFLGNECERIIQFLPTNSLYYETSYDSRFLGNVVYKRYYFDGFTEIELSQILLGGGDSFRLSCGQTS